MPSLLPAGYGVAVSNMSEDRFLAELDRIEQEDSSQVLRELLYLIIPSISGPPLSWAVERGFLKAASRLLRAGASPEIGIHTAIHLDDPRFLHILFTETATPRSVLTARWQTQFGNCIAEAARVRSLTVLATLLEYAQLPPAFNPLFVHHTMCAAAEGGSVECIGLVASALCAACGVDETRAYTAHRHTPEPVKKSRFTHASLLTAVIASNSVEAVDFVLHSSGLDIADVLRDLEGPYEATAWASDAPMPVLYLLEQYQEVRDLVAREAFTLASLSSALRIGHSALTALLLKAHGPHAGPRALQALRAGVNSEFVFEAAKATPGSAADEDMRKTVDALLCAVAGVTLAQLRADVSATARVRGALVSGLLEAAPHAASPQASVDDEVTWCLSRLPRAGLSPLPMPLVELLLALALPTALQSMRTRLPEWSAALRVLVQRSHTSTPRTELFQPVPTPAMLNKLTPRLFVAGFFTNEALTKRSAANVNAMHRHDGSAYHAPEPLAPLHFPPADALLEGDGSCPVCRSVATDCIPHCVALRSREDIADAELVRVVLAAAPDAEVRAALLEEDSAASASGPPQVGVLTLALTALKPTVLGELLRAGADPAGVLTDNGLALQAFHAASKIEVHAVMYHAPFTVCLRLLQRAFDESGDSWARVLTTSGPHGYSPLLSAAARADPNALRFFDEHRPGGLARLLLLRDGQPAAEPAPLLFNISSTRPYAMAMIESDAKNSVEAAFPLVIAATRQACADCSASAAEAELRFARLLHGIDVNEAGKQLKQATSPIRILVAHRHADAYTTAALLLREGSCYGTELSRSDGTFLHMLVSLKCQQTQSGCTKQALRSVLAAARSSALLRARFSALLKIS